MATTATSITITRPEAVATARVQTIEIPTTIIDQAETPTQSTAIDNGATTTRAPIIGRTPAGCSTSLHHTIVDQSSKTGTTATAEALAAGIRAASQARTGAATIARAGATTRAVTAPLTGTTSRRPRSRREVPLRRLSRDTTRRDPPQACASIRTIHNNSTKVEAGAAVLETLTTEIATRVGSPTSPITSQTGPRRKSTEITRSRRERIRGSWQMDAVFMKLRSGKVDLKIGEVQVRAMPM